MKFSQKNHSLEKKTNNKTHNTPQNFITKLNTQIFCLQQAIKTYNESDKNSQAWKKQLSMPVNSCQLKVLTQPKLQHILLEGNFIKTKQNLNSSNHSLLKSSIKRSQQKTNKISSISKQMKLSQATSISIGSGEKLRSKTTIDNKSSKQILQPTLQNHQLEIFHEFRSFQLLPITEVIRIPSKSHYQTLNMRKKILQKTSRLQKEWARMEQFRETFNINQKKEKRQILALRPSRKSEKKLVSIIKKVENRRPATSKSVHKQTTQQNIIKYKQNTINPYNQLQLNTKAISIKSIDY